MAMVTVGRVRRKHVDFRHMAVSLDKEPLTQSETGKINQCAQSKYLEMYILYIGFYILSSLQPSGTGRCAGELNVW
jgi:hypothetical protein